VQVASRARTWKSASGEKAPSVKGGRLADRGRNEDSGLPFNVWLPNTSGSKWLAPSANQAQSYDPSANGTYRWTLSFDLTGFDASTALLIGRWAADHTGSLF
jgi:hypothetical protein